MRSGSRLLSGACMEEDSMLLEHTLLPSGEMTDTGELYYGWPAQRLVGKRPKAASRKNSSNSVQDASSCSEKVSIC